MIYLIYKMNERVYLMKSKLSPRFWCVLTIFSLVGQIAWVVENMYFNVFIYKMFNATPGNIADMVMASAIAATLTTVFMGALSDRIGKRKLFICGGYILWGISIFAFVFLRTDIIGKFIPATVSAASIGVSLVIILDCVMTFFGSTSNDAAFNAWLTDSTNSKNRGAAEGINAMMPLVAILAVFGGFMAFDLNESSSWTYIFTIIGAVTTLVGIIGCFIIKEPDIKPSQTGYFSNIIYGFRPSSAKSNPVLYITLGLFIIFNISIQVFMPYLIIYYEQSLQMTGYVFIMAPAIIIASVVTAFWGKVYDKKGFNFSAGWAMIWLICGYVILFFFKSTALVFAGSLCMMCGYLSGAAVFGAKIRDKIPAGKSGMLQGVRIFSQVLVPGVVGPYIGKTVLKDCEVITNSDGTTSFLPNENIFLAALAVSLVLACLLIIFKIFVKEKREYETLTTPFEENVGEIPYPEYPRPNMKRESYMNLNGEWNFSVKSGEGEVYNGKMIVPFPPESKISGIGRQFGYKDTLVYERGVNVPSEFLNERTILHFGAVDRVATVFFNGKKVGSHDGGYLPFDIDVTEHILPGENTLRVEVLDDLDTEYAYGKQSKKRGGMWYTPISGIWQTVWLESVCENHIRSIKVTPDLCGVFVEVSGGENEKTLVFEGKEYCFDGDRIRLDVDSPKPWTPDTPNIYEFDVISGNDRVSSYFALRTVDIRKVGENSYICLNGNPVFLHGLLDQGYYSDGIYTPATADGYKSDILTMKKLGFNMLRKHIKIEPQLFYYYCDIYGMLVCQDMVNSGKYSFLIDTALPTLGIKRGISHKPSKTRRECFESDCKETISHLYNHPSVIYYTVFNEGWGQYDADVMYKMLKGTDPTRIFDSTSGWFYGKLSDVQSEHIYFKPVKIKKRDGRPVVLSEFGGYSCKIDGHSYNPYNTYGYRFFSDTEQFSNALEKLYLDEIVRAIDDCGLCAAVLTQVSDVEDETNGLLTYDRKILKIDEEKMLGISRRIYKKFSEKIRENIDNV